MLSAKLARCTRSTFDPRSRAQRAIFLGSKGKKQQRGHGANYGNEDAHNNPHNLLTSSQRLRPDDHYDCCQQQRDLKRDHEVSKNVPSEWDLWLRATCSTRVQNQSKQDAFFQEFVCQALSEPTFNCTHAFQDPQVAEMSDCQRIAAGVLGPNSVISDITRLGVEQFVGQMHVWNPYPA